MKSGMLDLIVSLWVKLPAVEPWGELNIVPANAGYRGD